LQGVVHVHVALQKTNRGQHGLRHMRHKE
jgi:hypothetical protein